MAAIALALAAGSASATYLLARSASVLSPLQFIGYIAAGYARTTRQYDSVQGRYVALPSSEQVSTLSADVILGASVLKNLELLAVAPIVNRSQGDKNAFGLGDASVMLRYGVLGGILPVKLTVAGAATMPTSSKDAVLKLADRTLDFGLGAQAQTIRLGPLAAHARIAYWMRGKAGDQQFGNMFEYVVFPDLAVAGNASLFFTLSGTLRADNVVSGVKDLASGSGQHSAGLGMTWNPAGPLWIKPKVSVPLASMSHGGRIAGFSAGLDIWAAVP